LDRGTFLPIDAYDYADIEGIAVENVGPKRRALLDDLVPDELREINSSIQKHSAGLGLNADQVKGMRAKIADLTEQIEELGDVQAKLAELPNLELNDISAKLVALSRQRNLNIKEGAELNRHIQALDKLMTETTKQAIDYRLILSKSGGVQGSANDVIFAEVDKEISDVLTITEAYSKQTVKEIEKTKNKLTVLAQRLALQHETQEDEYATVHQQNVEAGELIRRRTEAEQAIARHKSLQAEVSAFRKLLKQYLEERTLLKGLYLNACEQVSELRSNVSNRLQREAGRNIRIRVLRNADMLGYQQILQTGLRGARVRNHEDILVNLLRLRPDQLAEIIQNNDVDEFEYQMSFGKERSAKILEAFREVLDPLELEIVRIEDRVCVELNVSTNETDNYKDAAELSRGQKCTALLPLLLARRDTPLIIDQPEDNLDNHFIYETVVDTIRNLKGKRQMIFITHNANIPVLAEADLIIVMNSDGKSGSIQKSGSLDECCDEIIDLLEGGREAFNLRIQRYAR
jgi:DNA repair exonuclease SbcCD ATPase subunit